VSLHAWRAELLAALGRFEEAMASGREAVRMADATGHGASRATARALLGYVLISKGDLEAAVAVLESGLAEGERIGVKHAITRNAYPLGYVLFLLGRREAGLRALARASEIRGSASVSVESTRSGFLSASTHLHAGQYAAAEEALTQGLALAAARNDQGHVPPLLRVRADLLATREWDPAEELRLRLEGVRLATELGLIPEAAHGHFGLSRYHRRAGDASRVTASLATALDLYRRLQMDWWERVAHVAGTGGT
jgi:tetratricopeptide (TPR) repeat protein